MNNERYDGGGGGGGNAIVVCVCVCVCRKEIMLFVVIQRDMILVQVQV